MQQREEFPHPYHRELEELHWEDDSLFQSKEAEMYESLDNTPFTYVDSLPKVRSVHFSFILFS